MKHFKQTGLISKNTSTLSGESFLKVPLDVVSKSKTTCSYFMPSVVQGFLITGRVVGVGICSISMHSCTKPKATLILCTLSNLQLPDFLSSFVLPLSPSFFKFSGFLCYPKSTHLPVYVICMLYAITSW